MLQASRRKARNEDPYLEREFSRMEGRGGIDPGWRKNGRSAVVKNRDGRNRRKPSDEVVTGKRDKAKRIQREKVRLDETRTTQEVHGAPPCAYVHKRAKATEGKRGSIILQVGIASYRLRTASPISARKNFGGGGILDQN